ncbi:hypothetical protein [Siccibacter colletis]|uniref:hypothetical protein n=1 Tax=Siccibacter colletis TaxID=1505757 RepID=UPI0004E18DEC|nr:hypothetical protein [Siccibacter colletis]
MSIISVNSTTLAQEFSAWLVPVHYAEAFTSKNTVKGGRVILHPFFFNDTEHLTNPRHWLAINAAYWCCVYREAESDATQVEALAGLRSNYYVAGALGVGEIKALIHEWWRATYELHQTPAPNYSAVIKNPSFH